MTSPSRSPRCTVIPYLHVPGWYGTESQWPTLPKFPTMSLAEACDKTWRTDAMILMYSLPEGAEPRGKAALPRLNGAALANIALWPEDEQPVLECLLVDVDFPNHDVPDEGWHLAQLNCLPKAMRECVGWYRSRHGMRLIFQPPEPIPVLQAPSVLDWLHTRLTHCGIITDHKTKDFTRLFRVPKFPGLKGVDLPMDMSQLAPLPWSEFLPKAKWKIHEPGELANRPLGTAPTTEQMNKAKRPLKQEYAQIKDKVLRAQLIAGQYTVAEGDRHAALLSTAIRIVNYTGMLDPSEVHRLIFPSLASLNSGASRKIDAQELWRICSWAVAQVVTHRTQSKRDQRSALVTMAETLGITTEEARKCIVLDTGKQYYVWDEFQLNYSPGYLAMRQLPSLLRDHAPTLTDPILKQDDILLAHSSPVTHVIKSYRIQKAKYSLTTRVLTVPAARMDTTLIPTHHPLVHRWLCSLAEDDRTRGKLLDWLAMFPDLTKATCALYIEGPPSIGKGLLAVALAALWGLPTPTEYALLLKNFAEKISRCPLIWVDETLPKDAFNADDAGIFRRLVGSPARDVNIKNVTPIEVDGYLRVLMTANHGDLLEIREALTPNDLEAVKLRVGHIYHDESRRPELEIIAEELGLPSAAALAEDWLMTNAVAEHVLFLAETRKVKPGKRFAVEGWESPIFERLATSTGAAGLIAEGIARAIVEQIESPAVRWYDGKVYVSSAELPRAWSLMQGRKDARPPASSTILNGLKSLSDGETKKLLRYGRVSSNKSRLRYWEIKADRLARVAQDRGIADIEDILELCSRSQDEAEMHMASAPMDVRKKIAHL